MLNVQAIRADPSLLNKYDVSEEKGAGAPANVADAEVGKVGRSIPGH
jgi:S-adenosylmethionine synthetase